jgi:hypothetical protein
MWWCFSCGVEVMGPEEDDVSLDDWPTCPCCLGELVWFRVDEGGDDEG